MHILIFMVLSFMHCHYLAVNHWNIRVNPTGMPGSSDHWVSTVGRSYVPFRVRACQGARLLLATDGDEGAGPRKESVTASIELGEVTYLNFIDTTNGQTKTFQASTPGIITNADLYTFLHVQVCATGEKSFSKHLIKY